MVIKLTNDEEKIKKKLRALAIDDIFCKCIDQTVGVKVLLELSGYSAVW